MQSVRIVAALTCVAAGLLAQKPPSEIYQEKRDTVVLIKGPQKTGSGVIISADGIVATNYHVVSGEKEVSVKLGSGLELSTDEIVAADPDADLVLLKLKGQGFAFAQLGNSTQVKPGDAVVVISNPLGLEGSVTNGIISAVRSIAVGQPVFQISAPISPGSSGGPVFDRNGLVVAIARATVVEGQNVNFAIPSNAVSALLNNRRASSLSSLPLPPGQTQVSSARLDKAMKYLDTGMIEESLAELKSAIKEDEFNPQLHYALARALKRRNDIDGTIQQLQIALKLSPSLWQATGLLAEMYLRRGVRDKQVSDRKAACDLYEELSTSADTSLDAPGLGRVTPRQEWQSLLRALNDPYGDWQQVENGRAYEITLGRAVDSYWLHAQESPGTTGDLDDVYKKLALFSAHFDKGASGRFSGEATEAIGPCMVEESVQIEFMACSLAATASGTVLRVVSPARIDPRSVCFNRTNDMVKRLPGFTVSHRFTRVPTEFDLSPFKYPPFSDK